MRPIEHIRLHMRFKPPLFMEGPLELQGMYRFTLHVLQIIIFLNV